MLPRRLVLAIVMLVIVITLPGCTSYDQQVGEEVRDLLKEEWDRESKSLKQTAAAKFATLAASAKDEAESVFGTLIAKGSEVAPSVFGTLVAGQSKGPSIHLLLVISGWNIESFTPILECRMRGSISGLQKIP